MRIILCALLAIVVIGCQKKVVKTDMGLAEPTVSQPAEKPLGVAGGTVTAGQRTEPTVRPPTAFTIHFDLDMATIDPVQAGTLLEGLQSCMVAQQITVTGYCCPLGTDEYNDALGAHRADAVAVWLIGQGIAPEVITTRSMGERDVISYDPTSYWRNRRVVVEAR